MKEINNSEPKIDYKVLVCCFTYNQSQYIEDALNGFAMQQTKFPFVCLVMDDCSTDGEQEVIKAYLDRECDMSRAEFFEDDTTTMTLVPHRTNVNCTFAVYFLKKNLYGVQGAKAVYVNPWREHCEYEALCEGDDYWTDPYKLQKQVDILEADATLMAVVTNSSIVDQFGKELTPKQENVVKNNVEGRYDLRTFMRVVHHYPTATVCYRNTHQEEIQKMKRITANPFLGDWTLWIILHIFGDFYYLDQVTSAYRINPTSVTHDNVDERRLGLAKANFGIIKSVQQILPPEYDDIREELDHTAWIWFNLANAYKHSHMYLRMCYALIRCFLKEPKFIVKKFIKRS